MPRTRRRQAPERHSAARVSTVRGFLNLRAPSSHNEVTIIEQHISTRSASRLGPSQLFSMFRHSDNNQEATIREPLFSRNSNLAAFSIKSDMLGNIHYCVVRYACFLGCGKFGTVPFSAINKQGLLKIPWLCIGMDKTRNVVPPSLMARRSNLRICNAVSALLQKSPLSRTVRRTPALNRASDA